jgi:hypothetical protein
MAISFIHKRQCENLVRPKFLCNPGMVHIYRKLNEIIRYGILLAVRGRLWIILVNIAER